MAPRRERTAGRAGGGPFAAVTLAGAVLFLLAAAAMLDGPRGDVDWRAARAVVLESDDWGLCGFFPKADALTGQERVALRVGAVPPPYWESTLEDSADVARLAALLGRHRGRDGGPAILQVNMILSALSLREGEGASPERAMIRVDCPDLPALYARPRLWAAVDTAIARGVWRPEYHGAFHYDPERRRAAVAAGGPSLVAARRGVPLFEGSATAWELGHWRSTDELTAELERALALFAARFGRLPVSVCAPDYVWDGRCEQLWAKRGMTVIQAKREQRDPRRPGGSARERALKWLGRALDRVRHPERTYLERNCRFEPAQAADSAGAVDRCLRQIRDAWARGEPAIVETHRVNYVSLEEGRAVAGAAELDRLLAELTESPDRRPLFLTDDEVAQLARTGTSWSRRGGWLIVRNLTHSVRLVSVPELSGGTSRGGRVAGAGLGGLVTVPAGATVLLGGERIQRL